MMKQKSKVNHTFVALVGMALVMSSNAGVPLADQGEPFQDSVYAAGPQHIPGRVECAYYDLGGKGVAYHDTDPINHGSGELNLKPDHHRPHANPYIWSFRANEGVDISYTKDFADFNHTNFVSPVTNQLYIGWTADGEWCNYTVAVKMPGAYRVIALYGNAANTIRFSINGHPAAECKLPLATGSFHVWNKAEIGTITFPEPGLQLLTFHYNGGNNFAYFEFEPISKQWADGGKLQVEK
jgi:hypothetical protein